jgi:hypothetical protein
VPDILRGLAISAGILLPVVVLIIFICIVVVRRGEAAMRGDTHAIPTKSEGSVSTPDVPPSAPAVRKPEKPVAVSPVEENLVMTILGLGFLLFALAVLGLFLMSVLQHL